MDLSLALMLLSPNHHCVKSASVRHGVGLHGVFKECVLPRPCKPGQVNSVWALTHNGFDTLRPTLWSTACIDFFLL